MATSFSEAVSRAPLRSFSIVTFSVCMLVLICDGMDAQLLGIFAPKVIEDFGTEDGEPGTGSQLRQRTSGGAQSGTSGSFTVAPSTRRVMAAPRPAIRPCGAARGRRSSRS